MSQITTSIKCDDKKLILYSMIKNKKHLNQICGAITSTKSLYCYNYFNKRCSINNVIKDVKIGATISAISGYTVLNFKMYKVFVYIISELRLILVLKYLFQISCVFTLIPLDHKCLKNGANYYNKLYNIDSGTQTSILVLISTNNNDRNCKIHKLSLLGDPKCCFIVHNEIWTRYVNVKLAGKMLNVRGYCEWGTIRYIKYSCKQNKILSFRFNITILMSLQNKPL